MASIQARIQVTLELVVGDWNESATFEGLKEQVRRQGMAIAQGIFQKRELKEPPRGCVVGQPKVLFVQVSEDGRKAGE